MVKLHLSAFCAIAALLVSNTAMSADQMSLKPHAQIVGESTAEASRVFSEDTSKYKLKWQNKLLAFQHAYAQRLLESTEIDWFETGSITH